MINHDTLTITTFQVALLNATCGVAMVSFYLGWTAHAMFVSSMMATKQIRYD